MKNLPRHLKKKLSDKNTLSRKDFKEHPLIEELYKLIHEYSLREEAYKTAIQIYLQLKK